MNDSIKATTHLAIGKNTWHVSPRKPLADGKPRLAFCCITPGPQYSEHGVMPTESIAEVKAFLTERDAIDQADARAARTAKFTAALASKRRKLARKQRIQTAFLSLFNAILPPFPKCTPSTSNF
jgi:hypothetical protein